MVSASAWYEQGVVLDIGSTVAALLAVAATVWAALYAAQPGRALLYLVRRWRPAEPAEVPATVTATRQHRLVVADVQLRGGGRRDIPSTAFDAGQPLTISLNGQIIAVLAATSYPGERTVPAATACDGKLEVSPGLIGRGQILTYRVLAELTDLSPPRLTVSAPLIDVRIGPRQPFWQTDGWMYASVVLAPLCFLAVRWLAGRPHLPGPLKGALLAAFAGIGVWLLGAVLTVFYSVFDWVQDYFR